MPHSIRARAAATGFAAVAVVAGLGAAAPVVFPVDAWFPLKAAACCALVVAVVVARISTASHPFAVFGYANQVTMARAAFVSVVAAAIGEPRDPIVTAAAAAMATAVTLMDGVDGWLARRHRNASAFGARFDMETDALLILALSILAWRDGKAGAWVLLSGLLRYAFVVVGWIAPWMAQPLEPSRRRQTICVVQVVALIAVVEPFVTWPLSAAVAAAALGLLIVSFVVDTRWLVCQRQALERREEVAV